MNILSQLNQRVVTFLSITLLSVLFLACGNEGHMEGMIEGVPFRMDIKDVLAVRGYYAPSTSGNTNYSNTSYYDNGYYSGSSYGNYYASIPLPLTIIMGDSTNTSNKYLHKLTIYIIDMNQIYRNFAYPLPSNNIYVEFEYQFNGQVILSEATETSYITFYEDGRYEGQEVAAEFFLGFTSGSLYGSFSTDIGLNAR